MAGRRRRTIAQAVRELLLAFPGAEEFESHGAPNFRARQGARKGRIFAVFAVNHHGDGHVALWLNTPAADQARHVASAPKHIYKPPYLGPYGWIAVELNRGFSWGRTRELVREAYTNSTPAKILVRLGKTPVVAPPGVRMKPEEIDRLRTPRAQRVIRQVRRVCLALPATAETVASGFITWRVGKKGFASLYDYGKGLTLAFWVGISAQGAFGMDERFAIPKYLGSSGWIALDMGKGVAPRELEDFLLASYRHFAPRRALANLDP